MKKLSYRLVRQLTRSFWIRISDLELPASSKLFKVWNPDTKKTQKERVPESSSSEFGNWLRLASSPQNVSKAKNSKLKIWNRKFGNEFSELRMMPKLVKVAVRIREWLIVQIAVMIFIEVDHQRCGLKEEENEKELQCKCTLSNRLISEDKSIHRVG